MEWGRCGARSRELRLVVSNFTCGPRQTCETVTDAPSTILWMEHGDKDPKLQYTDVVPDCFEKRRKRSKVIFHTVSKNAFLNLGPCCGSVASQFWSVFWRVSRSLNQVS